MSDPFVRWLQSRLAAHGLPTGAIDGVFDKVVADGLKAFQARAGLPVNALANAETVAALRTSSSTVGVYAQSVIPDRDDGNDPAIQRIALVDQRFPRQADVPATYGAVGTRQTTIELPFSMKLAWSKTTRVRRMTLHEKVAPSALRVFQMIAGLYSAEERTALGLDLFGGSLNVRRMRGGKAYSMHSWGIAIDFDPERNGLETHAPAARLSHADAKPFWDAWAAEGWLSLGRARDFDWMHVQAARL